MPGVSRARVGEVAEVYQDERMANVVRRVERAWRVGKRCVGVNCDCGYG